MTTEKTSKTVCFGCQEMITGEQYHNRKTVLVSPGIITEYHRDCFLKSDEWAAIKAERARRAAVKFPFS